MVCLAVLALGLFLAIATASVDTNVRLNVTFNASAASDKMHGALSVNGIPWLPLAPDSPLRYNNTVSTQTNRTLQLFSTATVRGSDALGSFLATTLSWRASAPEDIRGKAASTASSPLLETTVRVYSSGTLAVFSSRLHLPLANCTAPDGAMPSVAFPRYAVGASTPAAELGYAYWHGLWPQPVVGSGLSRRSPRQPPARHDGPVVFSSVLPNGTRAALVLAPLNDPLNTVFTITDSTVTQDDVLSFGPAPALAAVPAGYACEVAAVVGEGTTAAMATLRGVLRAYNGGPTRRVADPFVERLTLWTDNGAYLFWNPAGKAVLPLPEVAIPAAVAQLQEKSVRLGGVQLDGWWMNQTTLAPDATLFPSGWDAFQRQLAAASSGGNQSAPSPPLLLYKAFFTHDYDLFATLNITAVQSPTGAWYPAASEADRFFSALFLQGRALGMSAYETDFMSDHLLPTPALASTVLGLPSYLGGLARAGARTHTPMQWCMPTAGMIMFAAALPAVSNARASVDYACEGPQGMNVTWAPNYMIGIPGLLFWAADVPPSKDIFWSSATQPGVPSNCGPSGHGQPNFEMDAVLAVLSTGPVGLGDGPGLTNASLANSTCRADSVVLKPDKPLTALDATFLPRSGPRGFVGFLPMTAEGNCSLHRPCAPAAQQTHVTLPVASEALATRSGEHQVTHGQAPDAARHRQTESSMASPVPRDATWYALMSINLGAFVPTARELYPVPATASAWVYREQRWARCANNTQAFAPLPHGGGTCLRRIALTARGLDTPLMDISSGQHRLDSNGSLAWQLYHLAPELPLPSAASGGPWFLLGEPDKIVPVSGNRFANLSLTTSLVGGWFSCLHFSLAGVAGERITVGAVDPGSVYREHVFDGRACPWNSGASCAICSESPTQL